MDTAGTGIDAWPLIKPIGYWRMQTAVCPKPSRRLSAVCLTLSVLAVVAFGLLCQINLAAPVGDYDEGVYLVSARLLSQGQPLFGSVFSSQPPLFLEILSHALRVFGDSIQTGREVAVLFSMIALAGVGWIGWRTAGPVGAPVAIGSLALSFHFLLVARNCKPEIPALALGLLALGAVLEGGRRDRMVWLPLAGACFAWSLLCKLLTAPMIVPILISMAQTPRADAVQGHRSRWGWRWGAWFGRRLLWFANGGLIVTLLALARYDLALAYDQVVRFHLTARVVYQVSWLFQMMRVGKVMLDVLGVTVLAVAGLIALARRDLPVAVGIGSWLAVAGLFLTVQTPLFPSHMVLVVPPLAIAAAGSVRWLWPADAAARWRPAAVALLLPLVGTWPYHYARLLFPCVPDLEREAIALIERHSQPAETVVSDWQMQVFAAGRTTPPSLCDTSLNRIQSGYLHTKQAIEASRQARLVVFWSGRLQQLPGYRDWVRARFRLVKTLPAPPGLFREIYLRE